MGKKHDWIVESKFIRIHKNVLSKFGINRDYQIERPTDQYLILSIKFEMTTQRGKKVLIEIKKDCEIDTSLKLKDPPVKTYSYTYHARYSDGRNLLRYCSPDRDFGHRAKHHKHTFDSFGNETKNSPEILQEDLHPHVSEFLDEIFKNF